MAVPKQALAVEVSLADDFHAFSVSHLSKNAILNYEKVTDCAKKLKTWLTDQDNREMLPPHVISDLARLLEQMANTIASTSLSEEPSPTASEQELDLTTECLRCLRNSCADCRNNQEAVSRTPTPFIATKSLLLWGLKQMVISETMHNAAEAGGLDSQKRTTAVAGVLRSGVQFLGNAVVDQDVNAELVWDIFIPVFRDLLQCQEIIVCDYVAMVIYNVIKLDKERIKWLISDGEGQGIALAVIENLSHHNLQWSLCLLQSLLVQPTCMEHLFPILTVVQRQLLLEVTLQMLDKNGAEELSKQNTLGGASCCNDVAAETVQFIATEFKTNACTIVGLHCQEDKSDEEGVALLTVTYLDVLCSATANHHGYEALRKDVDLLKCSINLLHCMRMIGMEGRNIFTNISKLADSQVVMTTEAGHPIHGLKRNLIRLIGNMSYCNKDIQDQVRELGGIPLIMEHMNIDTRNEFIMQWAIVAIRNLCKDNVANQVVIADTKLEAIADNVGLLRDFGVDAEISGDKIVVKKVEGKDIPPTGER